MTRKVFVVELTEEMASKIAATRRPPASKRGAVFADAWKMGKAITGYDESSPIWGLRRDEVNELIEARYRDIIEATGKGDAKAAAAAQNDIDLLKAELEKRKAARAIAWKSKGGKKA